VNLIADAFRSNRIRLLVGAGICDPIGDGQRQVVTEGICRELLHPARIEASDLLALYSNYSLESLVEALEYRIDNSNINLEEYCRIRYGSDINSETLKTLAELGSYISRIYTTSLDFLIEEQFPGRAKTILPKHEDGLIDPSPTDILIIHLHGALTQEKEDRTTGEGIISGSSHKLLTHFSSDLGLHDLVIIGYSLNDPHLHALYQQVSIMLDNTRDKVIYLVSPVNNISELTIAADLWMSRGNCVLVPMEAKDFLKQVRIRIRELDEEYITAALKKQLGDIDFDISGYISHLQSTIENITRDEIITIITEKLKERRYEPQTL